MIARAHIAILIPVVAAIGCGNTNTTDDTIQMGSKMSALTDSNGPDTRPGAIEERRLDVERWVFDGHLSAGREVVATEMLDNGQVVDWVRAPGPEIPPDPPDELPKGVVRAQVRRLSGPPGAVPYIRPTFDPYIRGESKAQDLAQYVRELPHGHPFVTNNRMYGASRATATNLWSNGTSQCVLGERRFAVR